jgi:hypothetical protein
MAYQVNKSDGSYLTVQDNTINTETSLKLIGKNFAGYGEYVAENFLQHLENFASPNPPVNPVKGQMWYKSNIESFFYFNGIEWIDFGLSTVGPMKVTDTNGIVHIVTANYDEGNIIAITSNESFSVAPTDPVYDKFNTIGSGITLTEDAQFHGTATTALYADLAEIYMPDREYEPGTVVRIGGSKEITHTIVLGCKEVFGVISTAPAYLMNSAADGVPVALTGRVPVKVTGKVRKGDRLIASGIPGVAQSANGSSLEWTQQVGRALEDKNSEDISLIEAVIGAR